MGVTPDRFPGSREEEEVIFDDETASGNPTAEGGTRRVKGDVVVFIDSQVHSTTRALSITDIQSTEEMLIPERRQMTVHDELILEGDLLIEGDLILEI